MLGQQHTAVWNALHVRIWSFGFDIVTFGGVESICHVAKRQLCNDLDDVDRCKSNEWVCMALEKKYVSDSVSIVSLFIENKVLEWHFLGIFTLAASKTVKASHTSQLSLQFTASSCHWIVYGEVLLLYVTIFDDWHCEYDRPWCCKFLVKILKWKMTVSHEVECSRRHVNMFWDHNNILDKDTSVRFERGVLFLLQTLDLFVRQTIHAKCNESSYLSNQRSNDEAGTCPELAMT